VHDHLQPWLSWPKNRLLLRGVVRFFFPTALTFDFAFGGGGSGNAFSFYGCWHAILRSKDPASVCRSSCSSPVFRPGACAALPVNYIPQCLKVPATKAKSSLSVRESNAYALRVYFFVLPIWIRIPSIPAVSRNLRGPGIVLRVLRRSNNCSLIAGYVRFSFSKRWRIWHYNLARASLPVMRVGDRMLILKNSPRQKSTWWDSFIDCLYCQNENSQMGI